MKSEKIPYGYCQCGCGQKTNISTRTNKRIGYIKGKPQKYAVGHYSNKKGKSHPRWNGGYFIQKGYLVKREIGTGKITPAQNIIAEKVLGKPLPKGAMVHHVDEDKLNNLNNNLVICQDRGFHNFIHARMNAFKKSGNARYKKCARCHCYDDPKNMVKHTKTSMIHKKCESEYKQKLYKTRTK